MLDLALHLATFCVVVALPPQETRSQEPPVLVCDSATIAGVRAALVDLRAVADAGPSRGGGFTAVYEGAAWTEAHLSRPGARMQEPLRLTIAQDGDGAIAIRKSVGPADRAPTETLLIVGAHAARRPADDRPFAELPADEARRAIADAVRWLPSLAAEAALASRPTCRPGPPVEHRGATLRPVSFTDPAGSTCGALFDAEGRLARLETLTAHPRLGDVCAWTRFAEYETHGAASLPRVVERFAPEPSVTREYRLELRAFRPEGPVNLRADAPAGFGAPPPAEAGFEILEAAPGLFTVEVAAADARVLVLEREKDLVLIYAPDGDDVAAALLRFLSVRFPSKPVAIVACGHHHPSSSGGLRVVAAAGAAVVVPRAMEAHYRLHFARPTSLGAPCVPGPAAPKFEFFEGETRIEAGANTVRLLDIGERSAHTEHYVVFHFPGSGVLFEDDLGYFPADAAPRPTSRLRGLLAALREAGVVPTRLIQGWPVRGVRREVPWSVVEGLFPRPAGGAESR